MRPLAIAAALLAVAATLAPGSPRSSTRSAGHQRSREEGVRRLPHGLSAADAAGRSWRRIFAGLDKHFGEKRASISRAAGDPGYLLANAAQARGGEAPLRITEQRWWVRNHREEVRGADWAKAKFKGNCTACHARAERGLYGD